MPEFEFGHVEFLAFFSSFLPFLIEHVYHLQAVLSSRLVWLLYAKVGFLFQFLCSTEVECLYQAC